MQGKRRRTAHDDDVSSGLTKKYRRLDDDPFSRRNPCDRLSALSDELTIRILSFLPIANLLDTALVSRHFSRLASDSQLWRALYYSRFVLPRALRIPGFRQGSQRDGSRLQYSSRRAVWADGGVGRRGALLDMQDATGVTGNSVDWKRQYKLRHNWARGKATVEELDVGGNAPPKSTLVKVVEGIAITADMASGLRAWDLKSRALITQTKLRDNDDQSSTPTCIALDEQSLSNQTLEICVGFSDGGFGCWRLDLSHSEIYLRYRHAKSSNGGLIGVAYRHPFLLTATASVLISLYDFNPPATAGGKTASATGAHLAEAEAEADASRGDIWLDLGYDSDQDDAEDSKLPDSPKLRAPILVTSLKSHTSQAPIALSIRSMAGTIVASVAYTFSTRRGWSIGIQDLHVRRNRKREANVAATKLAYTMPVTPAVLQTATPITPPPSMSPPMTHIAMENIPTDGPISLCYTHPYLLATLPDNTLVLHVCTSTASTLAVSPGIRLWGHTSGISDAEITARGKAVSVSCRGEEIRVWELEGRGGGSSIEVRPNLAFAAQRVNSNTLKKDSVLRTSSSQEVDETSTAEWDERRNWVGFDDEMVIVLKESRSGRESLLVYDFT